MVEREKLAEKIARIGRKGIVFGNYVPTFGEDSTCKQLSNGISVKYYKGEILVLVTDDPGNFGIALRTNVIEEKTSFMSDIGDIEYVLEHEDAFGKKLEPPSETVYMSLKDDDGEFVHFTSLNENLTVREILEQRLARCKTEETKKACQRSLRLYEVFERDAELVPKLEFPEER